MYQRQIVDEATRPYYSDSLPEDILLTDDVEDIWMRDFSTVHPEGFFQFRYEPNYWDDVQDAVYVQQQFTAFAQYYGLEFTSHDFVLDGGNIVDNGKNSLVTTTRFLDDNDLRYEVGKTILEEITEMPAIAILPPDDEVMGHSDGMVMWADENTLLVNQYDEPFRSEVLGELQTAFPEVQIIEVPNQVEESEWRSFNSACGVHVNSVVTYENIYMPTFGTPAADNAEREAIAYHTPKTVHHVSAACEGPIVGIARC